MVLPYGEGLSVENAIRIAADTFLKDDLFFGHGTSTAIDEASWLVLFAIGLSPIVEPDYSQQLNDEQVAACNKLLSRRIEERLPAAYLTGQAWFAGHQFLSDERALVPRSPLAEFINDDFFGVLDEFSSPRILDLCTGGGCIAIATALARPTSLVDASDLSGAALSLAAENIALHQLEGRVSLYEGSLFEPIREKYALIVSNPPYVDAADIAAMPDEFSHEPLMGLEAGQDGLDLVREMLLQAADYLEPNGSLVVEVGNSITALEAAYPQIEFSWLQFAHGGHGVFLLTREELLQAFNHTSQI
ncbi:MAG: 50S ribosomal protein L3 N(5)-glutamine methyltransferase [Granulosicoccus sp.]